MKPFTYQKIHQTGEFKNHPHQKFLAGGTTLIDLMKLDVETPAALVDINSLPLSKIEVLKGGGVRIGALVKNSDLAHDAKIKKDYRVLSEALLSGASAQLRNKATTAGNLLQRTRCVYFRDTSKNCNKRAPGSGCSAIDGFNRNLAILGASASCIATNPSDMNVALMALEAKIEIEASGQHREVEMDHFYFLPGETPHLEFDLKPNELITAVTLAPQPTGSKSVYLKLRDRASYEFALSSAAVVAQVQNGVFKHVRIALGGVATKPWRAKEAEDILTGHSADPKLFRLAAEKALKDAKPQSENGFKIELAKRCLSHALKQVSQA